MSRAKIIRKEITEAETSFSAIYMEMKNACIVFLSEGEDRLGTLAVSLPQRERLLGPPLSSVLFGDRNVTIARLLAERVAATLKKMTLISVFSKSLDEQRVGKTFLKLLEKIVKKEN